MYEYHEDKLCVQGGFLYKDAGIISKPNYDALKRRNKIKVIRIGGNGRTALVEFKSLPQRYKDILIDLYGDPHKKVKRDWFEAQIRPDKAAAKFYSEYKLADGRSLPLANQKEYRVNAEVLNAVDFVLKDRKAQRKALGGTTKGVWESVNREVNALDTKEYPHTLPSSLRRLKSRHKKYMKNGYHSLIHKGFCNDNSRKVNEQIERLILSLYCHPTKPYAKQVHDLYLQFLGGKIDVIDVQSGEMFQREHFFQNGEPVMISENTVWNYVSDPKNMVLVDKHRMDDSRFRTIYEPHHHRKSPDYALSKISMDDRDLPRKLHNGKRVKAYYSYDVQSGCVIGASYSRDKNRDLFIECMRDTFRFIDEHGLGMPLEVEVENHLVNNFKDGLMKAGIVFPFVRWCNPGNSQEKRAEHFNRTKKYGYEKKYQEGIGRFYNKLESNRPNTKKYWDEEGMKTRETSFDYDQLIAEDLETIRKYNNAPHRNQKGYPGMTRLEVLKKYANPDLAEIDRSLLARYIGEKTETSINRTQWITVQYAKYQLPDIEVIGRLQPNNYKVDAYWIPEKDGDLSEIYLYQNDLFICKCELIETYNEARAERTDKDYEAFEKQAASVAQFRSKLKERSSEISSLEWMERDQEEFEAVEVEILDVTPEPKKFDPDIDDLLSADDDNYYERKALEDL